MRNLPIRDTVACGVHISILCPEVVEICARLGFGWFFLDAERTPLDHRSCRELVRAADAAGLPCVVRVPEVRPALVEGYLDTGAVGIVAPRISSAAEARALVSAVKFSPIGQRGAAARTRAADYGLTRSPSDYYEHANRSTFTVALLESRPGIDQLEAIAAVPGIDCIGIGANDLGLSLGIRTGIADPTVRELVERARAGIRRAGKPQMAVVTDAVQARQAIDAGAKLVAIPDVALLLHAARSFVGQVSG